MSVAILYSQKELTDLEALINDDVLWFYVAMAHAVHEEVAFNPRQLLEDVFGVFQRHWSVLGKVSKQ